MVQKIVTFDVALKSTERQWVQKIPEVYTNDLHSVSLQFRITDCTDTELTGSTAIVLLKMRDGSFFQRPSVDVTRTLNVFSYTLKENEGNHDGLAEIQLVVTIAGKEFGSQKYNFKVISGLDSEIAREIMIYDWSTLTAEARAYIDQFTADEVLRDAEFDNAQFDRNAEFDETQRQRVIAFNSSEAARVSLFNSKETARAAGYDADHSRAETDHTGAVADRTNAAADRTLAGTDHTRAESDHTRADADSATVAGFNARLIAEETATANNKVSAVKGKTFADVDARLEAVEAATALMGTNLVTNGDFSNGTTGWADSAGTHSMSVTNGELSFTGSGAGNASAGNWIVTSAIAAVLDSSLFYLTVLAKSSAVGSAYLGLAYSVTNPKPLTATYQRLSLVTSFPSTPDINRRMTLSASAGIRVTFTNALAINLTATFGAGKEPTLAEMDRLMARFPNSWFDGVTPIQTIETLYQEKANKVQEDWITPTLLNGATGTIRYRKNEFGRVEFKGLISGVAGSALITMPAGYRPTDEAMFTCRNGYTSISNIRIQAGGGLYLEYPSSGTQNAYMDSVTYASN